MSNSYQNKQLNNVLLISYGGGHVALLAPIAVALEKEGIPFTFIALTTAKKYLDRLGIPSIGFKDLPEATDKESLAWGERLSSTIPSNGLVDRDETIAYLGANFKELQSSVGIDNALNMYKNDGRAAFLPIQTLNQVIQRIKPSLVISTNSPRSERSALLAANLNNVNSICFVDLFGLQEAHWLSRPNYATKLCVLNNEVKDMLVNLGRDGGDINVTGNPAFDRLYDIEIEQNALNYRNSKNWSNKKIVLWAPQSEPNRHPVTGEVGNPLLMSQIRIKLIEIFTVHPDWHLVVRFHPGHYDGDKTVYPYEVNDNSEPIETVLAAVDAVLITNSTIGMQSVLLNKALITFDMSVFSKDDPYSKMGLSRGVDALDDLESAISEVLDGRWQRKVNYSDYGPSIGRCMKVIKSLLPDL